jgi:hypothetical protein
MLRVGRPEDTVSTLCVGRGADAHYPYAGGMAESYDSNAPAIMETEHPSTVRNLGEAKDTVAFRRGGIARSRVVVPPDDTVLFMRGCRSSNAVIRLTIVSKGWHYVFLLF